MSASDSPASAKKVVIHLRATGDAPILKQAKFKIAETDKFAKVIDFLRRQLHRDSLFTAEQEEDKEWSVMGRFEHGKNLGLKETDSLEDYLDTFGIMPKMDKWRNLLKASYAQTPYVDGSRKHAAAPIPASILFKVRELAEMHAQVPPNVGMSKLAANITQSVHQTRSGSCNIVYIDKSSMR